MKTMLRGACLVLAGSVLGLGPLQTAGAAVLPDAFGSGRITVYDTWCSAGVGTCNPFTFPGRLENPAYRSDSHLQDAGQTQVITMPGNYDLMQDSPSGDSAISLDWGYTPAPYAYLSGTYDANGSAYLDTGRLDGALTVQYAFIVSGPEDGPVSVHVNAHGGASGLLGRAQLLVGIHSWRAWTDDGPNPTFAVDDDFIFQANAVNYVTMALQIYGSCDAGFPGSCNGGSSSAFVDPVFTLGQDLLDQGYGLAFSSGVGNSAAPTPPSGAPEPSAWALLIGGFGATGAMLRRRAARRSAAQARGSAQTTCGLAKSDDAAGALTAPASPR